MKALAGTIGHGMTGQGASPDSDGEEDKPAFAQSAGPRNSQRSPRFEWTPVSPRPRISRHGTIGIVRDFRHPCQGGRPSVASGICPGVAGGLFRRAIVAEQCCSPRDSTAMTPEVWKDHCRKGGTMSFSWMIHSDHKPPVDGRRGL